MTQNNIITEEMRVRLLKDADQTTIDLALSGAIKNQISTLLTWINKAQNEISATRPGVYLVEAEALQSYLEKLVL